MRGSYSRRFALKGVVASAATLTLAGPAFSEPATHLVRITGFEFVPKHLAVRIGDRIRWVNEDLAPHTATANEFGWDTGELEQNQFGDIVVTKDMEIQYFCIFHPHMVGRLTVV